MEGGRPEKLSGAALEKVSKEYSDYLAGVKKDALSMLEDGYRKIRSETSSALSELYSSYEDYTKSLESSLELNLKLSVQRKRNEIIEAVLAEAERRLFELGEKERERLYSSALKRALSGALGRKFELHTEAREKKLFEKLIKKMTDEEVEVKADLPEGSGGFVLYFTDTGISQDFTLKRAFELMKDELMVIARKSLFEEE